MVLNALTGRVFFVPSFEPSLDRADFLVQLSDAFPLLAQRVDHYRRQSIANRSRSTFAATHGRTSEQRFRPSFRRNVSCPTTISILWLVARRKDRDRRDREDDGEDGAAVTINFLRPFRLLVVIKDRRHHNFDQGKENE